MLLTHGKRNLMRDRIRRFFGGMPRRIQVAALPWRADKNGNVEILLVTSRDTGRWVLPKGWPEGSEGLHDAAAREAVEEAGVTGTIGSRAIGTYHYAKRLRTGLQWRCAVHVFPLAVEEIADRWPERKKRRRQWFRAEDAAMLVREPDLAELIAAMQQRRVA